MGWFARAKSLTGMPGGTMPVLPTVAAPLIPTDASVFTVTGTTAITGFSSATPVLPGRHITLIGTHATGPAFTDTAIASTANGLISLSAALTLGVGKTVTLAQLNGGGWTEVARSANG